MHITQLYFILIENCFPSATLFSDNFNYGEGNLLIGFSGRSGVIFLSLSYILSCYEVLVFYPFVLVKIYLIVDL